MARAIRFKQKVSPYNAGESAGFADAVSARYVAAGLADYVVTDVPIAPVTKATPPSVPAPDADDDGDGGQPDTVPQADDEKPKERGSVRRKRRKGE